MDWLNIHTSTIDSEPFVDSAPVQRATWLMLLRFCCGQENGGTIEGAEGYSDRKWQQLAGVTLEEVKAECRLWRWRGKSLLVEFYPADKEAMVRRNRVSGASGGKARARAHATPSAQAPATSALTDDASSDAPESASTEGKGREGKGMEGKGSAPSQGADSHGAEIPSDDEVREFCAGYQDFSIGSTGGMPEAWWTGALAHLLTLREPVRDWRRWLMLKFRGDFTNPSSVGHAKAHGMGGAGGVLEKNGARPMSAGQRLYSIDQELKEVAQRLEDAHELAQAPDVADVVRERELQKMRSSLAAEGGQAARPGRTKGKHDE